MERRPRPTRMSCTKAIPSRCAMRISSGILGTPGRLIHATVSMTTVSIAAGWVAAASE